MNIREALAYSAGELSSAGVDEAVRESSTLLQHVLGCERVFLIAHPEVALLPQQAEQFRSVVARRAAREPLHYITGRKEFFGRSFRVTPAVLIPRPETEMLVAKSIELLAEKPEPTFAELGVGSGCISISILADVRAARAVATDISAAAIEVARINAAEHSVDDRLELLQCDLFVGVSGRTFDLIISNPPYVHSGDIAGLQPEVRGYEPLTALTDGGDGLSIIARILEEAPQYLKTGGGLLIEIGAGQSDAVRTLEKREDWAFFDIIDDLRGIPRMVFASRS